MTLSKPTFLDSPVSAGQPVTAQAWNEILSAIGTLFDEVIGLGGDAVDVVIDGGAVTAAVVVAVPATGAPVVAVPPRGGGSAFTLPHLKAGAWTVHVAAPGFAAAQAALTVPAGGPLAITLTANAKTMPDLLGRTAQQAIQQLSTDGIQLGSIYDAGGTEVSTSAFPADRNGSRVLFQFPTPGTAVTAATANTRLVLAALPTVMVKMPDLKFSKLADAQRELTNLGLIVTTRT